MTETAFPDLTNLHRRHALEHVRDRISSTGEIMDLAQGLLTTQNGDLLPAFYNRERRRAWERAERQTQTLGPEINRVKIAATLGDINWGGRDEDLDENLTRLDLRSLARRLLERYWTLGITAAYATPTETGEVRITRLGGHVEPYTHPDDLDVITGLYQAQSYNRDVISRTGERSQRAMRWRVRTYDWESSPDGICTLREWRDLRSPTDIGVPPSITEERAPRPRFRVRSLSEQGFPLGELMVAAPYLLALLATDLRLVISEEMAAFPILKTRGDVELEAVGPAEVIAADVDSDAEWMQPGSLEELRAQRRERAERVRQALSLPGGFLGNDSPSGEALREANVRFRMNAESYARDLSGLLTELVQDYAALLGVQPADVSVSPSSAFDVTERVERVLSLHAAGLLPLDVAAREAQPLFPTWSDEELERWVEQQTARVNPLRFRAELTGDAS